MVHFIIIALKVLLTFTGFHDPFAASAATGEMRAGPILTVVAERPFDRVYLFTTPKAVTLSQQTAAAIHERHPEVSVEILEVPLKDPTNYLGILRQIRSHYQKLPRGGVFDFRVIGHTSYARMLASACSEWRNPSADSSIQPTRICA
jgi:hypothetical protein